LLGPGGKRCIVAIRVEDRIHIDGRLDDVMWSHAQFQGHFIQREPEEGRPSTERTEVGILYDKDNIYFGLKCYDSEPGRIIANEMRRDAMMRNDDTFSIILDTYHDQRSGFLFTTNPNGAKWDLVLANEGRNMNSAWDGIWTCKANVTDEGWIAEIAIPWKTLRFAEGDSSIWGINFSRTIRRKNEEVFWQLVPRNLGYFGLFRLSEAGTLEGMRDLKMGGNVELKPYLLGGMERDAVTAFSTQSTQDAGLDAKFALTANLALDLTVNTDFAQVEADREQVNLTRFSLYFPEKREFFLEGAEVFSFGRGGGRFGGGGGHGGSDLQLFYSRRIGLVEGRESRILGGAKVVGKIGRTSVGVLNMLTDETVISNDDTTYSVGSTNFSVVRVRRDILRRGSIGAMLLNKEILRSHAFNRAVGFDGYFPLTRHFTISGTISGSFEPSDSDAGNSDTFDRNLAGTLDIGYDSDLFDFSVNYMDVGERFNPEMGFIRRVDYRYTRANVEFSPRPKNSRVIRQFRYQLRGSYRTDHTNRLLDSEITANFTVRFQNSSDITLTLQKENEFLPYDWEVRSGHLIPEGTYGGYDFSLRANSDRSRAFSGRLNVSYGHYYGGNDLRLGGSATITRFERMRMELDFSHNLIQLPTGNFRTNTFGLRSFYYFSTELYFKAYVQWNGDRLAFEGREKMLANLLLRWIYRPGSDLYVVYNDIRLVGPGGDEIQNRTLMLKATFFWRK